MYQQTLYYGSGSGEEELIQSKGYQQSSMELPMDRYLQGKEFLEGGFPGIYLQRPQESGYSDADLLLNVHTNENGFLDSLHGKEDYLSLGMANPNDVLPPTLEHPENITIYDLEKLNSLSLDDVERLLQFDDGRLDLDSQPSPYSTLSPPLSQPMVCESQHKSLHNQGHLISVSSNQSIEAATSSNCFYQPYQDLDSQQFARVGACASQYTTEILSDDIQSTTSSSCLQYNLPDESWKDLRPSLPLMYPQILTDGLELEKSQESYQPYSSPETDGYVPPLVIPEPVSSTSNPSATVSPSSSSPISRKGYKHRHERVYGLSEEEQIRRNQLLNNEASQLYRQKKTQKSRNIRAQLDEEEKRKARLLSRYTALQKDVELYKKALHRLQKSPQMIDSGSLS